MRLRLSVNDAIHRGGRGGAYPPTLLLEILAQAALGSPAEAGDEGEERIGYLGGITTSHFSPVLMERPLGPGDQLEAAVEPLANFGRTLKVRGVLRREKEILVEAEMILVMAPG